MPKLVVVAEDDIIIYNNEAIKVSHTDLSWIPSDVWAVNWDTDTNKGWIEYRQEPGAVPTKGNENITDLGIYAQAITDHASEKILPKTKEIAIRLIIIYVVLTFFCAFFYKIFGMEFFDSLTHSMTTIATGGFSNYNDSIGHFNNFKIDQPSFEAQIECSASLRFSSRNCANILPTLFCNALCFASSLCSANSLSCNMSVANSTASKSFSAHNRSYIFSARLVFSSSLRFCSTISYQSTFTFSHSFFNT